MNQLLVAESHQSSPVQSLLAALGVQFSVSPLEQIAAGKNTASTALLLSEAQFVELGDEARQFLSRFRDVLLYPFHGTPEGLQALGRLVGGRAAGATPPTDRQDYVVGSDREMCGPFAGLRVAGVRSSNDVLLGVEAAAHPPDFVV